MKYTNYNMREHGFVGHMAEPEKPTNKAVIVIMGGEKGILPGIKIAERFADFGITGLSVSLLGGEGLSENIDRIPLDMFENAIKVLREQKHISKISTYGISMGSILAMLIAVKIGGIDNVILCSPSHVPFEATAKDKKHMLGHSMVTWRGAELPFVHMDFSEGKMNTYIYYEKAGRKVLKMWTKYFDAYQNKEQELAADIHPEKAAARILLIAGTGDEAWPSDYSVAYLFRQLKERGYAKEYKMHLYPNASHLIGVMPNREKNKWLYRAIPLIGMLYQSFRTHKKECMQALEESEKEIIEWINQ